MTLTIDLPKEEIAFLNAKATAEGLGRAVRSAASQTGAVVAGVWWVARRAHTRDLDR